MLSIDGLCSGYTAIDVLKDVSLTRARERASSACSAPTAPARAR